MDVFVIPIGGDRYELYCESPAETGTEEAGEAAPPGFIGRVARKFPILGPVLSWFIAAVARMRQRFSEMLRAAEERRHTHDAPDPQGWVARLQDRMMAWVAERIAEQRLLWNLRRETHAVLAHPQDMTFEQVLELVRRRLQRDYDRHRRWLLLDGLLMILAAALTLVPGPNLVAYYFVFRVVGHWLSMRGARQGLDTVIFTGRPCPPLTELRGVADLEPEVREQRIHDVAHRLRLQHLSTFLERVAV